MYHNHNPVIFLYSVFIIVFLYMTAMSAIPMYLQIKYKINR